MPLIEELLAYVAEDEGPEDEGIIGMFTAEEGWLPLVGADRDRMRSYRDTAQDVADATGKRIRLIRFSTREELEVIDPA